MRLARLVVAQLDLKDAFLDDGTTMKTRTTMMRRPQSGRERRRKRYERGRFDGCAVEDARSAVSLEPSGSFFDAPEPLRNDASRQEESKRTRRKLVARVPKK